MYIVAASFCILRHAEIGFEGIWPSLGDDVVMF
jgi:hypothetical protein